MRKETSQLMAVVLLLLLCGVIHYGSTSAQAGYVGIFGGGPFIDHNTSVISEIQNSGFTEVIVWSLGVSESGDLAFNSLTMASNGTYVGDQVRPYFASDLAAMKQGSVERITFSIGSSVVGDWERLQALVDSNGTDQDSILYKNFKALKEGIPSLDAIDYDDENNYDMSSTVKFSVMLGNLGYHVMPDAYTNNDYWTSLVSTINSQLPGTVDGVHLQCYCGGDGNDPCVDWDFGGVPVYPGLAVQDCDPSTPSQVQSDISTWHSACNITGGFMWLYDEISGKNEAAQYATAIKSGLGEIS